MNTDLAPLLQKVVRTADPERVFVPAPTRRVTPKAVAVGVLAVAVSAVVSLLRQPGVGALDTVWAEDGSIFLNGATMDSPLHAIATSYAGYYHLFPRLVAELVALAPPSAAAALMAIAAAVWTGIVAVFAYVASASYFRSDLSRLLVAAVPVLVPVAQGDLPNSIANLHWYAHYALFWALLWVPRSTFGKLFALAVVVLAGGSDLLTVAFLPLAVYRLWRRPDGRIERHAIAMASILVVSIGFQLSGLLTGASSRAVSADFFHPATGFVLRVVPGALFGNRLVDFNLRWEWFLMALLAWGLVGAAVLLAWRRITQPAWSLAAVALLQSLLLYITPVFTGEGALERYSAVPAMLVVVALVALLQPASRTGAHAAVEASSPATARSSGTPWPLYVFAGLMLVVWVLNLRIDNYRAEGPAWSSELDRARATCEASPRPSTVVIPVPPQEAAWTATLPCDYLTR